MESAFKQPCPSWAAMPEDVPQLSRQQASKHAGKARNGRRRQRKEASAQGGPRANGAERKREEES